MAGRPTDATNNTAYSNKTMIHNWQVLNIGGWGAAATHKLAPGSRAASTGIQICFFHILKQETISLVGWCVGASSRGRGWMPCCILLSSLLVERGAAVARQPANRFSVRSDKQQP